MTHDEILKALYDETRVGNKPAVLELTQKGLDLMPVLMEMLVWADLHMEISQQSRDFAKLIRSDRKGAAKRILEKLRAKKEE